jgi:outer membrane autotransporter protein
MSVFCKTLVLVFALGAAVLGFGTTASAQDVRENFTGLTFGLGVDTAGDGGYATGSVGYLFPIGNGSVLVGPTLGLSGYSMSTTEGAANKGQPFVLARVLGEKTTDYDHQLSLGVRVGSALRSGRTFVFGEAGVERYDVTTSQMIFTMNKKVVDQSNDHKFGGYAAVGAEYCATQTCKMSYRGQIRYHDLTENTSVQLGIGIRF